MSNIDRSSLFKTSNKLEGDLEGISITSTDLGIEDVAMEGEINFNVDKCYSPNNCSKNKFIQAKRLTPKIGIKDYPSILNKIQLIDEQKSIIHLNFNSSEVDSSTSYESDDDISLVRDIEIGSIFEDPDPLDAHLNNNLFHTLDLNKLAFDFAERGGTTRTEKMPPTSKIPFSCANKNTRSRHYFVKGTEPVKNSKNDQRLIAHGSVGCNRNRDSSWKGVFSKLPNSGSLDFRDKMEKVRSSEAAYQVKKKRENSIKDLQSKAKPFNTSSEPVQYPLAFRNVINERQPSAFKNAMKAKIVLSKLNDLNDFNILNPENPPKRKPAILTESSPSSKIKLSELLNRDKQTQILFNYEPKTCINADTIEKRKFQENLQKESSPRKNFILLNKQLSAPVTKNITDENKAYNKPSLLSRGKNGLSNGGSTRSSAKQSLSKRPSYL